MERARDLMEKHLLTVGPETPLFDVYRLFAEDQIGAAPVVDDCEEVVGVITSADLIRVLDAERDTVRFEASYLRDLLPFSQPDWGGIPEDLQDRLAQLRVSDAMTKGVVSVSPDASAAEVARTLLENRMHHVFVIEDEILQGVVSTYDLLTLIAGREGQR